MLLRVVIEAMRRKKETGEGTLVRFNDIILSGRRHSLSRPGRKWAMLGIDQQIESLRDEITDVQGESGLLGFLAKTLSYLR